MVVGKKHYIENSLSNELQPQDSASQPSTPAAFNDMTFISLSLPVEVCENIMNFIFDTGLACENPIYTWYSCALVCRSWLPRSRFLLYRYVRLDSKQKANKFMASVSSLPTLGEYVQGIAINPQGEHGEWIYKIFQVLPPLLPNLHSIEFLALPVLHALFFVLSSRFRTVDSLVLHGSKHLSFRDLIRIVNSYPNLTALRIWTHSWNPSVTPVYTRQQPFLSALKFPVILRTSKHRDQDGDIFSLITRDAFPALQNLFLEVSLPKQSLHLESILEKYSSSLEAICISINIRSLYVANICEPVFIFTPDVLLNSFRYVT